MWLSDSENWSGCPALFKGQLNFVPCLEHVLDSDGGKALQSTVTYHVNCILPMMLGWQFNNSDTDVVAICMV